MGASAFGRLGPFKGEMPNTPRYVQLDQCAQHRSQHRLVSFAIAAIADGAPERVFDRGDTRCANSGGKFGNVGQDDGRHPRRFDLALHQSDGPVTDWSGRE